MAIPGADDQPIRRELEAGERLLWTGRATRVRLGKYAALPIVFGCFFAAFATLWIALPLVVPTTPSSPKVPAFFALFGLIPLTVGLCAISVPFWLKKKAAKSMYGITDRRAIVIEGALFGDDRVVTSFLPDRLGSIERTERSDGSGDLVFEQVDTGWKRNGQPMYRRRGFIGIEGVREVERLLKESLKPGN